MNWQLVRYGVGAYIRGVLVAVDQLGNALRGGDPDETLSSGAGRARTRGVRWGCVLCHWLDRLDSRHCEHAEESDEGRNSVAQLVSRARDRLRRGEGI